MDTQIQEHWRGAELARGHRKIDLIMLNVKLTLRGRGCLVGLGLTLRKKKTEKKTNEMIRKATTYVFKKQEVQKQLLPKQIYNHYHIS